MPVSKRLRYEILRRDNHACRYCGARAPDVALVVDHVIPVALGGTNESSNLVAACRACNIGKTSTSPDAPLVADVAQDALRWSRAMAAATSLQDEERDRRDYYVTTLDVMWRAWTSGSKKELVPKPEDWERTAEQFFRLGLDLKEAERFIRTAMLNRRIHADEAWRYFCGCCWTYLRERQDIARDIFVAQEPNDG